MDLYFKVNRHGFYQQLYDHDSNEVYSKLPVGVRPLAVSFRPRTDLADFSVFTPVTYSLEYGPKKGGHSPAMDGFTRVQLSKDGLYPAVNPKPFPESPAVGLWVVQDTYLKPKAYSPRIDLRLYYTSDEFIFPDPKEMKVTVTKALLITPTSKAALDGSTSTQITLAQVLSVLSGTPPGIKIKVSSIVSGTNVDSDTDYGVSVVDVTLTDGGAHADTDITVTVSVKHNYLKGPFYASFKVGDKFWVTDPAPGQLGSVWGSNPYHVSSNMVTAAKHAGLLTAQSPYHLVTISKKEWKTSFAGSTAHGVTSFSGNQAGTAFTLS